MKQRRVHHLGPVVIVYVESKHLSGTDSTDPGASFTGAGGNTSRGLLARSLNAFRRAPRFMMTEKVRVG